VKGVFSVFMSSLLDWVDERSQPFGATVVFTIELEEEMNR
jgi:hypothetical protein